MGSVLLIPLVASAEFITTGSSHPDRVSTQVFDLHGRGLDILPCVRLPKGKGRAGGGGTSGAKNKRSNAWAAPFLDIQRQNDRSKCNCAMTMLSTTSIITIGAPGDLLKLDEPVVVSDVQGELPVCTSFAALAGDEELVSFKGAPAIAKAKTKPEQKQPHVDA